MTKYESIPAVRIRGVEIGPCEYQCGRCGIIAKSSKSRIRDERGRRKVKFCKDCTYEARLLEWIA